MQRAYGDTQKKILDAYESLAQKMLQNGYRGNWRYIASKALSDWALLSKIKITDSLVLNIGCFEPIEEIWFSRRVKGWVAIEISRGSIKAAKKILRAELSAQLAKKVSFVVADATHLCFKNETFDVAVAFSTLDHIPNRKEVMKEMNRVVRNQGHVVVTVPNRWNLVGFHRSARAMRTGKADYSWEYSF